MHSCSSWSKEPCYIFRNIKFIIFFPKNEAYRDRTHFKQYREWQCVFAIFCFIFCVQFTKLLDHKRRAQCFFYKVCSYEDYQLRVKLEGTEKRRDQRLVQPPQTSLPSQVNVLPLSCRFVAAHFDKILSSAWGCLTLCTHVEL